MSCRTTPAGSAITSYARIAGGPGIPISDVGTLSLFHGLRREFQARSVNILASTEEQTPEEREETLFTELQHRLPHEIRYGMPRGAPITPESTYTSILDESERSILSDESITDARRASLLSRLADARTAEVPDNATLFALARLYSSTNRARESQGNLVSDYARTMGISLAEALAKFRELENGIDRARTSETDEYYTSENRDRARQLGIIDEAGSVRAFIIMREEMSERRLSNIESSPRLLDSFNVLATASPIPGSNHELVQWAHDTTTGHAEFVIRNTDTGEVETRYHRIGSNINDGMNGTYLTWSNSANGRISQTAGEYYGGQIRDARWTHYSNETDALEAATSRQCALCGQFANMSHTCPNRFADAPRYILNSRAGGQVRTSSQRIPYDMPGGTDNDEVRVGTFQVDLPLVNEYRAGFRESGLMLIRNASGSGDWRDATNRLHPGGSRYGYTTRGDFALIREEDGTITANVDRLTCSCGQYAAERSCIHQIAMGAAAVARATPATRSAASMSPEERVRLAVARQAVLEQATLSDWTRGEETLAEAKRTWTKDSEVSYYDNFTAFETVYAAAVAEKSANGKPTIPYIKENAFGGLATRETGQGFGIELEYDFPEGIGYNERKEAEEKIGKMLKEANITATAEKQGYHAAARNGYQDRHVDGNGKGTWSWEHDGSVAGEIVTPVMYDEPETWQKLEKVLDILKEAGAVPSIRAGAHVHVGTGSLFGADPKKYSELAKLYSQHEDVVYRISTDPERGTHRGLKTNFNYASPNPGVAPSGFADASAVKRWQGGRTKALNLNTVYFDEQAHKSHVEFRVFDSTLDAGSIQAQVKLAVSMTAAAARIADEGITVRQREAIGSHSQREKARGRRRATAADIQEDTSTFRSLMDTLFTRAVDKEQMTKLFAGSDWVKLTASQRSRHNLS